MEALNLSESKFNPILAAFGVRVSKNPLMVCFIAVLFFVLYLNLCHLFSHKFSYESHQRHSRERNGKIMLY